MNDVGSPLGLPGVRRQASLGTHAHGEPHKECALGPSLRPLAGAPFIDIHQPQLPRTAPTVRKVSVGLKPRVNSSKFFPGAQRTQPTLSEIVPE